MKRTDDDKLICRLARNREDPKREERISTEIIVDAYGSEEQAMGWYYYLEAKFRFPFVARCIARRAISPLKPGDEVEVVAMAPEEECEHEMFVKVRGQRHALAVPLSQITPVAGVHHQTQEAVEDWHYWVGRGYEL